MSPFDQNFRPKTWDKTLLWFWAAKEYDFLNPRDRNKSSNLWPTHFRHRKPKSQVSTAIITLVSSSHTWHILKHIIWPPLWMTNLHGMQHLTPKISCWGGFQRIPNYESYCKISWLMIIFPRDVPFEVVNEHTSHYSSSQTLYKDIPFRQDVRAWSSLSCPFSSENDRYRQKPQRFLEGKHLSFRQYFATFSGFRTIGLRVAVFF